MNRRSRTAVLSLIVLTLAAGLALHACGKKYGGIPKDPATTPSKPGASSPKPPVNTPQSPK